MRRTIIPVLCALLFAACVDSSGAASAPRNRLVLVLDPTVLAGDSSAYADRVVAPLRSSVAGLAPDSWVDIFVVTHGHMQGPAEFSDSIPFDSFQSQERLHKKKAEVLASRVEEMAWSEWHHVQQTWTVPTSCILSTIRRTASTLSQTVPNERIALVVISDLREFCDEFGDFNLEDSVPENFGALPAHADLSGAKSVHLVLVDAARNNRAAEGARIRRLWTELFERWYAPHVSFDDRVPADLFASPAMSPGDDLSMH